MQTSQYLHFVLIGELEDDRLTIHRHSFEHLCVQLQGKVNICPFHAKETRTGRSDSNPSTSSGMVYPASSAFWIATSERMSFSACPPSFCRSMDDPIPAPSPLFCG